MIRRRRRVTGGVFLLAGEAARARRREGLAMVPSAAVASRRSLTFSLALFGIGLGLSFLLFRLDLALRQQAVSLGSASSRGEGETWHRIIPGSPAITEWIFALGQGHRVAGVGDDCTYPPEVLNLPRVGSLYNPNFERLALLQPDLVVIQGRHDVLHRWADREGIAFHSVGRLDSLNDLRAAIDDLGDLLGVPDEARRLRERIDRRLAAVAESVRGARRVPVFLSFGRTPGNLNTVYTCGPGSFLSDLLQIAGGENVFSDAAVAFPVVSKESLVERAPEVILELFARPLRAEVQARLRQDWAALSGLPAVSNGRIYYLAGSQYQIPGPRITDTARDFARALHPESFSDE